MSIFLKGLAVLCVLLVLGCFGVIYGVYYYLGKDLPKIASLGDYRPPVITTVYSDDQRKIGEFFNEKRIITPLNQVPKMLKDSFIAAEDTRYYKHKGVDFISIVRAFFKNLEAGTIVQGGSTITQQVTKSFFLTPERTYERKIREIILAYRIDKALSKDEVLFLYLNQIYLGHGAYGVEAAARNYFGKSVNELNLAECAMMAGLPQAPGKYSPLLNWSKAKERQLYVLNRMVEVEYISNVQASEALNTRLDLKKRRNIYMEKVPYFTEYVRRYVAKKYGRKALYKEGLKVYTAVNIEMQKDARRAVENGLTDYSRRQGYFGPVKKLSPMEIEGYSRTLAEKYEKKPIEPGKVVEGVVVDVDSKAGVVTVRMGNANGKIVLEDMDWARVPDSNRYPYKITNPAVALSVGDVILVKIKKDYDVSTDMWSLALEQPPAAQAALLCMDAETGHVKAMVGGSGFRQTQFNRATQSRRQPGSSFKPIVYAAAIDKGYTAASIIIDSPIVFRDKERDFKWKPKNYKDRFYGPTFLRKAMEHSRNVVTIKILQDIGISYVIDYAKKVGIDSRISEDLSIALGSSGISLLENVRSYSAFANAGYLVEPVFITKIVDRDGNVLEESQHKSEKVMEKSTAFIMTSLLEGVVQNGTGRRIKKLGRPAAGKTGTTNNLYDAWFMGFTPRYVTGVWVGRDEEQSLGKGETGSRAASPIWLDFMKSILKEKSVRVFQPPEDVVFVKIDAETGLLPIPESKKTRFEVFKEGTAPTEYTPKPNIITDPNDIFRQGF